MRYKPTIRCTLAAVPFFFLHCADLHGATLYFESLDHGQIVTDQYRSTHGVSINASNSGGGPDLAIVFDSTRNNTRDPDLEGPWNRGNLAGQADLGNLLIIAENGIDRNNDGRIDNPDDEGSRPAGSIFLDFDTPIHSFGFDLLDVEGPNEYSRDSGYFAVFYSGNSELSRVGFGSFADPNSPFYDATVRFGDSSANRIQPITAAELGLTEFDGVEINFGGSGAIDNLAFMPVPLPSATFLLGSGLAGLFAIRRRKKQNID